jgi:hypothetical protein
MFPTVKKISVLVLTAIAASACGRAPVLELGEFAPYVAKFEQTSIEVGKPVQVNDLVVKFGPTEERQDAVCETGDAITPTILINQLSWSRMTEADREALMYHELGHCVLGRNHITTRNTNGQPISLMYPVAISAHVYLENKESFIRELFLRTSQ